MDSVSPELRDFFEGAFRTADEGYFNGRVAATFKNREVYWSNWSIYCQALGVDPYLQGIVYQRRVRTLSGFAGLARQGYWGRGRQIRSGSVSGMLSAIGKEISLVHEHDLTKVKGTDKFVPRLQQTLEGWAKSDPPTMKKLPVEADIPEQILKWCLLPGATSLMWATGDWCLIAFYWLLRIGEYTVKGSRNETKQTVQFKMEDVTFFDESESGKITKLPWSASDEEIMADASATLKLDNQKKWVERRVCAPQGKW